MAHFAPPELERAATRWTRSEARRSADRRLEAAALAGDQKKAQKEARTIGFIDESGLSQRPHRRRTWAPRGQTPVLQFHFNWKTVSVIAGVTFWNFYFQIFEKNDPVRADHRVPSAPAASHPGRHPADLGPAPGPPQSQHAAVHPRPEGALGNGIPAALRAGTEPGGVHLGSLQAPRAPERVPEESLGLD